MMTLRRDRNRKNRKSGIASIKPINNGKCPNCGEPGPHFVPPSFGDAGFYTCKNGTGK